MSTEASTPIVEVSHLTKQYRQGAGLGYWLAKGMGFNLAPNEDDADYVHALDDLSFTIRQGEAFGIIGRNGAGKSTLLQILAGTLQPSSGTLSVRGRVTALLELGSGFNPEFSGRENIYLAGSILGISRAEMDAKLQSIEDFADIGAFINQPVKTYSTGMMMRVAFAVAVAVEPDVLIIDEALSVGDILFQQKCNRRMREMLDRGVTLLVVTHDTAFVLNMCDRALWLDKGRMKYLGPAAHCVREYVTAMSSAAGNVVSISDTKASLPLLNLPSAPPLDLSKAERMGDKVVVIEKAWLQNAEGDSTNVFEVGDWCRVVLLVRASQEARLVSGGCELRDRHGQVLFATGLRVVRRLIDHIAADDARLVTLKFKLELAPGQYTLDLGVGSGEKDDTSFERYAAAAVIQLSINPQQEVVHGLVRLPYEVASYLPRSS